MLQPSLSACRRLGFCLAMSLLAGAAAPVSAQAPLHQRIDQLISAGKADFEKQAAPLASDAEFLRRIYLDLAGIVPTPAEARAFLADTTANKRQLLIDRLLASPDFARHWRDLLDVMLMERRPDKHVRREQWRDYLLASVAANKPWDQLVREVLSADGVDPKSRPAAKFFLDRDGEPNLLTRDIGRVFLGMNLTCAQCHDHPLVSDYKQAFYYGLVAFLNRSSLFQDGKNGMVLAEKAEGEVNYQSVFDPKKVTRTTGPRVPEGPALKEPTFDKGKEYEVAPAKGMRSVPKYSRRAQLAGQVASAGNSHFKRNSSNRLWALMMGRGLVHPVDMDHHGNPPSHPELLDLLANEFAERKFDVRAFLRELALSKTYQRSSALPAGVKEVADDSFAVAHLKPLSPEQMAWSLMRATGLTDAERQAQGKNFNEAALLNKLAGNVGPFVATFGGVPGKPETTGFQATLDQALFLANGGLVRGWLAPRPGNLSDRLAHLPQLEAVADELYLAILTRFPEPGERQEVAEYLKKRGGDRGAALQELEWALLASAEFRFNH